MIENSNREGKWMKAIFCPAENGGFEVNSRRHFQANQIKQVITIVLFIADNQDGSMPTTGLEQRICSR